MNEPQKRLGTNTLWLIALRMSQLAIPPGTPNALAAGVHVLLDANKMMAIGKEATLWVKNAIAAVKAAPDNPYGDDDEVIATELRRQVTEREERKRALSGKVNH